MKNTFFACFASATLALLSACSTGEIQNGEKALLVTAGDFPETEGLDTEKCETYRATSILFGFSRELKYDFDEAKDPSCATERGLRLITEATIYRSPEFAKRAFHDTLSGFKLVKYFESDTGFEEAPSLGVGDESYSAYIVATANKRKLANIIAVRKGNTVFSVIIGGGAVLEDMQALKAMLEVKLQQVAS